MERDIAFHWGALDARSHARSPQFLSCYADAYYEAALTLYKPIRDSRVSHVNYEALPIVFLLRHAVELVLKAAVTALKEGAPSIPADGRKTSHSLAPLLKLVRENIGRCGLELPREFVVLVERLDEIDPESFGFRYATSKASEPSSSTTKGFSLTELMGLAERSRSVIFGMVDAILEG